MAPLERIAQEITNGLMSGAGSVVATSRRPVESGRYRTRRQTPLLAYSPFPQGDSAPFESYLLYVVKRPVGPEEELQSDRLPDGWEPRLTMPEQLTPLPLVEQALPIVTMFAGLVGRGKLARYRVAVLRELAVLPRARLPIRAIQDSVQWMEPSSATRLVRDLREAGLLAYDSRAETYQLTREARVVAAVCGALTTARVDYTRIIKILAATMRLADAMNAPAQVAYATFLSAIAILEFDYDELGRLLDDYSDESLLEAARMAESHVEDMRSLLDEQADMFARFHGDAQFLEHDQRAHHMIASLGRLAAEVISSLSMRAGMRMRGTLRVTREDLRGMTAQSDTDTLAALVSGSAQAPVFMPAPDTVAAFTALDGYLSRERRRPLPPPEPTDIRLDPADAPEADPADSAARALEELVAAGDIGLHEWVVCGTWEGAVGRMIDAVEAWSRYGPAGDNSMLVELDAKRDLCHIGQREVGWFSLTMLRKPAGRSPRDAG